MKLPTALGIGLVLAVISVASPAFACDAAGPNTHAGVVTGIDAAKNTLTLRDAQTGKNLTFQAPPGLLKGIALKDQVTVGFTTEGTSLKATSVRKAGG
ncbi:MAG: hypothetical protein HY727_20930 [Candidatus Rokubacteria bacterium]|nr:hypothetical protein [Candidatus Rokubacteria bacterium]